MYINDILAIIMDGQYVEVFDLETGKTVVMGDIDYIRDWVYDNDYENAEVCSIDAEKNAFGSASIVLNIEI